VGLRRAGLSAADLHNLKEAYKILYRSDLKLEEALESIEAEVPGEHARHLVEFIRSSKRGIARE
jgi:UDP-N-acetylglucosamine acyltransferase